MAYMLALRAVGLWNLFIFGLFTLIFVLIAGPVVLLTLPFDPERRIAAALTRQLWGGLMITAHLPFWRVWVTGTERLGKGPWVLVANHQSMLDIPLITRLPLPLRILARPGVFAMPVYGQMARVGKHINLDPTSRETIDQALAHAREAVAANVSLLVFPEGTRSDDDTLLPFNRGAFELALQAGADIVPVVVSGTGDALPKGSPFARRIFSRFHLQVLPPVSIAGRTRRQLASTVRDAMIAAKAEPRPWQVTEAVQARFMALGRPRAGWAYGKCSFDPVFWALHERMPKQGRWLDVGCGEGLLAAYLEAAGHTLTASGIDPDPDRISQARALFGDAFTQGDARTAGLQTYDAITLIDALHYVSPAEQSALLTRLVGALEPGGVLLIRDPDPKGLSGSLTVGAERALVGIGRHVGEGVQAIGAEGIVGALEGLTDVRVENCSAGTPFRNVLVWGRKR